MNHHELVAAADRMVAQVRTINRHDPGTRAMLRRGLGRPPEDIANFHAHAVVARYLPERCTRAQERAFYTVAALVAAQPRGARDQEALPGAPAEEPAHTPSADDDAAAVGHGESAPANAEAESPGTDDPAAEPRRTLGQSLAWAVENGRLKGDMVRNRLHLLARYRTDRLNRELPKLVAQLRADLVPIDWGLLLADLARWEDARDEVAKQWVQQYHRTRDQIQRRRKDDGAADAPDDPGTETA